ncbi:MAG: FAD-binding oxidoreductase [Candidatus Heimdallarchaeaceae archaeon]
MTLKNKVRTKFVRHLGKCFRDDETTIRIYSRDLADLPPLTRLFYNSTADAVVLPSTTDEVKKLFELATENKIPITPRSGGTAGLGGCVTYKKGIIVDVKGLESELLIEPFDQSVLVSPSTVISELQRQLNLQGFSLCSYPSSFHSATIGGWIAHGGYGVGSAKFGGALDQILALDVVLPTGEIKKFTKKEDIELFVGSNGTLGIITRIQLKIKFDIPLKQFGCTFDSPLQLAKGLKEISESDPYSIWFFNPKHVEEINKSFGYSLPERYVIIVTKEISYEEEENEFNLSFNQIIRNAGGQILDRRYITNIWSFRFKTFAMLKEYEDYLTNEIILPIETSSKYLQKLSSKIEGQIHLEGEMIGKTHYSLLMFLYFEEKLSPFKKLLINLKLYKNVLKGIRVKGYPYSTGLWFSGYYQTIFGKEQYKKYKEFKKEVDPRGISNPGKVVSPRLRFFPLISLKTALKLASRFM